MEAPVTANELAARRIDELTKNIDRAERQHQRV
jgi:hypothetical protein